MHPYNDVLVESSVDYLQTKHIEDVSLLESSVTEMSELRCIFTVVQANRMYIPYLEDKQRSTELYGIVTLAGNYRLQQQNFCYKVIGGSNDILFYYCFKGTNKDLD